MAGSRSDSEDSIPLTQRIVRLSAARGRRTTRGGPVTSGDLGRHCPRSQAWPASRSRMAGRMGA
eukprot:372328-Pyramimonas_sp.AAC.1